MESPLNPTASRPKNLKDFFHTAEKGQKTSISKSKTMSNESSPFLTSVLCSPRDPILKVLRGEVFKDSGSLREFIASEPEIPFVVISEFIETFVFLDCFREDLGLAEFDFGVQYKLESMPVTEVSWVSIVGGYLRHMKSGNEWMEMWNALEYEQLPVISKLLGIHAIVQLVLSSDLFCEFMSNASAESGSRLKLNILGTDRFQSRYFHYPQRKCVFVQTTFYSKTNLTRNMFYPGVGIWSVLNSQELIEERIKMLSDKKEKNLIQSTWEKEGKFFILSERLIVKDIDLQYLQMKKIDNRSLPVVNVDISYILTKCKEKEKFESKNMVVRSLLYLEQLITSETRNSVI
ncbi:hypothetical protein O9G_000269 [Rozella allomycis CSF55]|uniref:Uncharacterized protein n=1 Tax=Rozella allomycis (strain CSF55) TaxID=988480 RepID=A0A075AST8_ROZAC|nr:hypothetical protein O9G_000269 [Rozella allomycis CSF55]|eukprot:EPZ31790.1 hypothetical protein O9G_000269 [Rozella allomycis CSF55]